MGCGGNSAYSFLFQRICRQRKTCHPFGRSPAGWKLLKNAASPDEVAGKPPQY